MPLTIFMLTSCLTCDEFSSEIRSSNLSEDFNPKSLRSCRTSSLFPSSLPKDRTCCISSTLNPFSVYSLTNCSGLFFIPASMLLDKLLNYPPVSNLYNIIVQSAPAQKTRSELDYFCVSFNVWRSVNFCIPLVKPSVSGMLRLIIPEYSSEACQFYRQRSSSVC